MQQELQEQQVNRNVKFAGDVTLHCVRVLPDRPTNS